MKAIETMHLQLLGAIKQETEQNNLDQYICIIFWAALAYRKLALDIRVYKLGNDFLELIYLVNRDVAILWWAPDRLS